MTRELHEYSHFLPLAFSSVARGILCDNLKSVDTQIFSHWYASEDATKISPELFPQSVIDVAERNSFGTLADSQDSSAVCNRRNPDLSKLSTPHRDVSRLRRFATSARSA